MLGHYSVQQTEEYAITEQAAIGREMKNLGARLNNTNNIPQILSNLQKKIDKLKGTESATNGNYPNNLKLLDFLLNILLEAGVKF